MCSSLAFWICVRQLHSVLFNKTWFIQSAKNTAESIKLRLWTSSDQVVSNPEGCFVVAGRNLPGYHRNCSAIFLQSEWIDSCCGLRYRLSVFSDCNSTIELRAVSGVQGTLRTPFFPSYYPPDTNCTWTFTVRHSFCHMSVHDKGIFVLALYCVHCVISDAQRGDGLVSGIWGLRAEQSQLQPGLYTGTVGHPEPQVGLRLTSSLNSSKTF